MEREPRADPTTLAGFAALVVLVGANFVAIRFSNRELPPFWGGGLRFVLAATLFGAILVAGRIALPRGPALGGALVYGLLGFAAPFAFIYWATVEAPAGLAVTITSLVPLLTLGLAMLHGLERFRWPALVGGLLAAVGIAVAYGGLRVDVPLGAVLALLAGGLCFAETNIVAKRLPEIHPVAANLVATAVGAVSLLGLSIVVGEQRGLPSRPETLAALGYLITFGTIAVFLLFLFVIRRMPASIVAYEFVLAPIATVALAAVLLGEAITPPYLAGAALVLSGVYVGALTAGSRPPAAARRPQPASRGQGRVPDDAGPRLVPVPAIDRPEDATMHPNEPQTGRADGRPSDAPPATPDDTGRPSEVREGPGGSPAPAARTVAPEEEGEQPATEHAPGSDL